MTSRLFLGLVHYPVYNKNMETIATSVTNLDIHDIARCVATYGLAHYYIIHPLPTQHQLVREILDYWQIGYGSVYNPDRKEALEKVVLKESLEDVCEDIRLRYGSSPRLVVTDARPYPHSTSYRAFRETLENPPEGETNYLLLFGTGWGIVQEVIQKADYVLEPISGPVPYNHLSVRSAVAIILDRILGEKWWK